MGKVRAKRAAETLETPWPGSAHGCPVERPQQCEIEIWETIYSFEYALPGLGPGIHVLAAEIIKAQEDMDGRVKPDQGDLWLYLDHRKQPISLNRTAMGSARPSTSFRLSREDRLYSCDERLGLHYD
jgi:hypothetical protein